MQNVTAAILAGGKGKRFRPYTEIIPKPMIPVGPEEKPLLEHIIKWLSNYDIRNIILLVGYRWRQISNYFSNGARWGVRIKYSIDTEEYKNTGGALLNAWRQGLLDKNDLLIWYGDILAPLDINDLLDKHYGWNADATIVVADKYQVPVGIARINENSDIIELKEKPWIDIHATIGILTLKPRILEQAEKALGKSFDIMGELIPWMINEGKKVKAYIYNGPWYDIGSLERYAKLDHNRIKEFLKT